VLPSAPSEPSLDSNGGESTVFAAVPGGSASRQASAGESPSSGQGSATPFSR
jgi:hypothetical protein